MIFNLRNGESSDNEGHVGLEDGVMEGFDWSEAREGVYLFLREIYDLIGEDCEIYREKEIRSRLCVCVRERERRASFFCRILFLFEDGDV